jgi:ribonuclease I
MMWRIDLAPRNFVFVGLFPQRPANERGDQQKQQCEPFPKLHFESLYKEKLGLAPAIACLSCMTPSANVSALARASWRVAP